MVFFLFSHRVVWPSLLQPQGLQPARLLCPWDLPGKNTGKGQDFLLQGIFPTQGSKLRLRIAGRFFTTEPPGKPTCTLTHTLLISGFP